MREGRRPDLPSLLIPVVGSLVLTGAAVCGLCLLPTRESMLWPGLLRFAAFLLVVAVALHGLLLRGIGHVIDDPGTGATELAAAWRGTFLPAVLLPCLALLARVGSPWSAALIAAVADLVALAMRRWTGGGEGRGWRRAAASPTPAMFAPLPGVQGWKGLLLVLAMSVAGEGAVVALAAGSPVLAGVLLALLAVLLVEGASIRKRRLLPWRGWRARQGRRTLLQIGVAFLLTVVALTPFLRTGGAAGSVVALLGVPHGLAPAQPSKAAPSSGGRGGSLSGVILVLPPKPKEQRVPDPPMTGPRTTAAMLKPLVVPFDGQYWYFHRPDERPRADAKRVRGDPLKVTVRSTDFRPLEMEAHQRLEPPISTACCRALRLVVRRAVDQRDALRLQVVLRGRSGDTVWSYSLGMQPLPLQGMAGAEETLHFAMPPMLRERTFNEIAVVVRPETPGTRVGAHVSVERFELEP